MKRMSEKTHDFLATSICFNYNDSAIRCDDGDDDDDYCYFNLHCFAPQESSSEMCVHVRSRNNRCHTPNNATSVACSLNNGQFSLVYTPHIHLTSIVLSIEWKNTKQKTKEKEREFAQPRTFDRAIGHWPLDARAHTNKCYWWCLAEVDTYQTSAAHDFSLLHKTSKEKKVKVHGHGHIIRNRHTLFYTKNETNKWREKNSFDFDHSITIHGRQISTATMWKVKFIFEMIWV